VKILLSTNGGNNFNTVLIASTANDGSQIVDLPNLPTSQARIKVESVGNVFFDLSNVNFTIVNNSIVNDPGSFSATTISSSQIDLSFTPNASNNNVVIVWNLTGTFTVPSGPPPAIGQSFAGGILLYNGTSSPFNHTGLSTATTYYYKAFSYSGTGYSPGLTANARTVYNTPYAQSFDDPAYPPIDWSLFNAGTGNNWERTTYEPYAGAGAMYYSFNVTQPANAWAFTPGFTLQGGRRYYVSFYQKVLLSSFPEKLKVTVGNAPEVAAQTSTIWDNAGGSNLSNTTYELRTTEFNCTATGIYYFAFNCYSDADMRILLVDEISITPQLDVDLSLNQFYQFSGLPIPRPGENFCKYNVSLNESSDNYLIELSSESSVAKSSDENYTVVLPVEESMLFRELLSNIDIKADVTNIGMYASSFILNWYVDGISQTQYNGPTIDPDSTNVVNLIYSPSVRGTFNTAGLVFATDDGNFNNNVNSFRMRVYPDQYSRTIYDRGDNNIDDYFGWNNLTTSMKAGVRFTADSTIKLAGVDFIYRTEAVTSGQIVVQVRAAGSSPDAPGAVLYSKVYNTTAYFPSGNVGDYIHFAFGDDAPTIAAGLDYWIIIKMPTGILFPGGTHGSGFTSGRSYYEQSPDTTLWSPLVIASAEHAWIMRSVNVAGTLSTFQLSVSITDGWNMVSVPGINPDGQGVNIWWPGKDPAAAVYKYGSTGYTTVTIAQPTEGYWMKNSGAQTYNTGDEWPAGGIQIVPHDPINALAGWNLIGGYENIIQTSGLTTTPPGLIVPNSIYKYGTTGYTNATQFEPGYGYWIKLTGDGQIIIPDALTKESGEVVNFFNDAWGKIIITDNADRSYILYAVNSEVDLDQYELPPVPPAGMFDIRFGSGRIAEDLNSSIQSILMSGIQHPVKIRVENIDIRLLDETGKEVNVSIKSGEEITIRDATINKLMVSTELIPAKYALEQNYPNPFNPCTVIEFSLPEDVSNVKLSIYNALGEKVAELINASLTAGNYQYQWNAKNVATGMYIYELRTDKFISIKKMILLK
jgi:hypothetical protein